MPGSLPPLDALIDRAPSLDDLRAHRLHLLAAQRWREQGRPLPDSLAREEQRATVAQLAAATVLRRISTTLVGERVLCFKGIEAAQRYPNPAARPFADIDLLAEDAEHVQWKLLEGGFQAFGDAAPGQYAELHHLTPVYLPEIPILVEVHRRPAWPEGFAEPEVGDILERAVPSRVGVAGLMAPSPEHHALLITAHAWDFNPLGRLIDLLDIHYLAAEAGRGAVAAAAAELDVLELWATTVAASDAIFGAPGTGRLPRPARKLREGRDSTVAEQHLRRWVSPFWVLPPGRAAAAALRTIVRDFAPGGGESWREKGSRTMVSVRNAFRSKSAHEAQIGEAARIPPRRKRY